MCVSAGSDYFATSRQLDFSASTGTNPMCVDVDTIENGLFEETEQFIATLTGNLPRLTVEPDEATVIILDDDGEGNMQSKV